MPVGEDEFNGVIPVDKPSGPTSHDVVAIARRALGTRKIGHTGTLDPFASGLLLLCVGRATRLSEYLTRLPKSYHGSLRLGVRTDTDDLDGEAVSVSEGWRDITREQLERALASQRGERSQVPPDYSAKKVDGERMYLAARAGRSVRPEPVSVRIYRADLIEYDPPEARFEVDCSSGTYIRAIARDVGEDLHVGAHLTRLRRTRIGRFSIERALPLDRLTDRAAVLRALETPANAVGHLPRIGLSEHEAAILALGGSVEYRPEGGVESEAAAVALVDEQTNLVAIGKIVDGRLRPVKVLR